MTQASTPNADYSLSEYPSSPWPKLCECGCGLPAPIAKRKGDGYDKGQPKRFQLHHGSRVMTDATREKISVSRTGQKMGPRSAETRAKIAAALRGRTMPAETRAKVGAANKGKLKGRKQTPEHVAKRMARKWSRVRKRERTELQKHLIRQLNSAALKDLTASLHK